MLTPISPEDEDTRTILGYQGPANYEEKNRSIELVNLGVTGNFKNHMTAQKIRQNLGDENFRKSIKISIHREPIDFIVSLYWFQKTRHFKKYNELSLREWMEINYHAVQVNYKIAPTGGPNSSGIILNYTTLVDDIKKVRALPSDFLETFVCLNAKGNRRPTSAADPINFLLENNCEDYVPKIIELSDRARFRHEL